MIYKFRAYNYELKQWIYGDGINYNIPNTVTIHNSNGDWLCPNAVATAGRRIILDDSVKTEVYQGDILKYSFETNGEYYNRYYIIKENANDVWAEELWRDYELDSETFEVSRFHNTKYKGTHKDISSFNTIKPWKVIGTVWTNPELYN